MAIYAYKDLHPQMHQSVYIAPSAEVIGDVSIGRESSVWFGSILRGDSDTITIGDRTNIQDLSVCHADENVPLTIGNDVTIGHRCVVHGCTIEDECLIGMGAVVMNQAVIGKGSVIAAGTIVLENTVVPPYSLVAGSPGVIKKSIKNHPDLPKELQRMTDIYINRAKSYAGRQNFYKTRN